MDITVVEVSSEVANKVGGIYTVLASKMSRMRENISGYHAIGQYEPGQAAIEFEEEKAPAKIAELHRSIEEKYGIKCHYGRWLIGEKPTVTLVDPAGFGSRLNEIKKELWEGYGIDSLSSDAWFDGPVIWSKAAGIVLEEMLKAGVLHNPLIHFHEWLSGAALLHLKSRGIKVPNIFTTHATVLGRAIAEVGREGIHELISEGIREGKSVPDSKAYEYNVQAKHLLEKAVANNASVFTAVSETGSTECRFILGRQPDLVLPNGLDMDRFPLMEELSSMHIACRNRIRRFVMGYFSPFYDIDVSDTLFMFLSGRQEIRNKGIDVFIESLGRLNSMLRGSGMQKTVVAFIWVPAHTMERKQSLMENMALFENMEDAVKKETSEIEDRIMQSFAKGKLPSESRLLDSEFLDYMKKMKVQLSKERKHLPPLSAFNLEPGNPLLELLERNGLRNAEEDRIKVIYYPAYISIVDGLLNMNYYDAIIGCHVGVFPSYYESWGYTPLETAALGVQSITTDLSGFGKFVQHYQKGKEYGIHVLPREGKSNEESVAALADVLYKMYCMTKKQRNENKMRAKELSGLSDWKNLISNYMSAYELALKKGG